MENATRNSREEFAFKTRRLGLTGVSAPWLSVVMPVYNGAATLSESLASLCGQGDGIEVVIVDQGSQDESVELAMRFVDRLSLRIFDKPENNNWVQNTNFGIGRASAPLVTMLHQDDVWMPGRAHALRRLFEAAPDAALWVHAAAYLDQNGRKIGTFAPPFGARDRMLDPAQSLPLLIVQNTIAVPSAMFRKVDVLGAGSLDERLWYTADWDLWLRLATSGPVAWSPVSLVGFRLHKSSQTIAESRDMAAFREQLAIPFERHRNGLPSAVLRRAEVSNAVNCWLAARYHDTKPDLWPLMRKVLSLGPVGIVGFMRNSCLLARVLPRLRARL